MDLLRKYLGESEYHQNPLDKWLIKNGWEETHGIALYTNPKYPCIGVDTNSGNASIDVYKSKRLVFNDEGAMMDYTSKVPKLAKAIEKGDIVCSIWDAISKIKGYESKHLTGTSISLFREGYAVTIWYERMRIVMTLGGYNVKGEDPVKKHPMADNYRVEFPFKKSSVSNVVKQIKQWEKEQGIK